MTTTNEATVPDLNTLALFSFEISEDGAVIENVHTAEIVFASISAEGLAPEGAGDQVISLLAQHTIENMLYLERNGVLVRFLDEDENLYWVDPTRETDHPEYIINLSAKFASEISEVEALWALHETMVAAKAEEEEVGL